jgi:polyhydroxyalkanoate synthesis regulator phasin
VTGPRSLLATGKAIAANGMRVATDELVKRGRMTREDSRELAENFAEIARRQVQDRREEIGGKIRRSADGRSLRGALGKLLR